MRDRAVRVLIVAGARKAVIHSELLRSRRDSDCTESSSYILTYTAKRDREAASAGSPHRACLTSRPTSRRRKSARVRSASGMVSRAFLKRASSFA
jgi:hypothetical protein